MSYQVCRVQKMTSGSVRGIQIHDRREKNISHTNPDIDRERTGENYDLAEQGGDFYAAVKKRIDQLNLKRAVRKDAIVMAQVLVTSDSDFFEGMDEERTMAFFKDSYDFLADRYGRENVISATVHMDERTPHMHFNFVPVTKDRRLSAKDVLNRTSLVDQQDAFFDAVGSKYGLQRGERQDSGKRRVHMETAEYKAYTEQLIQMDVELMEATQDVENAKTVAKEYAREAAEAAERAKTAKEELNTLQSQIDAKKGVYEATEGEYERVSRILKKRKEELAIVEAAIMRGHEEGDKLFGTSEMNRRIAEAKERATVNNRLNLLERFIAAYPDIKERLDEFTKQSRSKHKER